MAADKPAETGIPSVEEQVKILSDMRKGAQSSGVVEREAAILNASSSRELSTTTVEAARDLKEALDGFTEATAAGTKQLVVWTRVMALATAALVGTSLTGFCG